MNYYRTSARDNLKTVLQTKDLYERFAAQANQSAFIKQLVSNNMTYRHILRFFTNLVLFAALLAGELFLYKQNVFLGLLTLPVYIYLQACVVFSFMVHSHELTHHHISTKWLNDTIGIISGAFIGLNFYSFQYAHRFHHANIGNIDSPEIGAPVSLKGRQKIGAHDIHDTLLKTFLKSRVIAYVITWPLHLYHGDYSSWTLPFKVRNRVHQRSLACFLALVGLNIGFFISFGLSYILLYLAPVLLAGVGILMLTFLHHAHEDSVFFNEQHHSHKASMMFTTDRDYGRFGNFFMMNNGFHIAHHLNPKIAYYDLKKASLHLREMIPSDLQYNYYDHSHLYRDFVKGIYQQRLDHNPEYYQLKYREG